MQEVGTLTLHELGAKAHPFFKQALVPYTPGGEKGSKVRADLAGALVLRQSLGGKSCS